MAEIDPPAPALISDPSSHMASLVAVMLRSLGIRRIDAATDLQQTAALLARQPYSLILLDEQIGGDGGFELIRALRQSVDAPNRQTPIIMMAFTPDAKMIAAARDAGVNEFLRKPFAAEHIKLRLDAMSRAPRPFVEAGSYTGPDRRRRAIPGAIGRRAADKDRS